MSRTIRDINFYRPIRELEEVGFVRFLSASAPMPMEVHQQLYELLYMETGVKRLLAGDQEYLLHGGDLLVLHPNEPHGESNAVQNRSSLMYLYIPSPEHTPGFLGLNEPQRQELTRCLDLMHLVRTTPTMRNVIRQLGDTLQRQETQTAFHQPKLRALLLLLLDALVSAKELPALQFPPDVQQAIRYIEDNPAEMPAVACIAQQIGLSDVHFKKKFKRYTGIPPAEYVIRHHVSLAQQKLACTTLSVTQIAMQLGFSSSQHFARQFRRYTGCSPTAYRKEQMNLHS